MAENLLAESGCITCLKAGRRIDIVKMASGDKKDSGGPSALIEFFYLSTYRFCSEGKLE